MNLKAISNAGGAQPGTAPPVRHLTVRRPAGRRFGATAQSGTGRSVRVLAGTRQATVAPAADFTLMNLDEQVALFGATDEAVEPPDTQVAAGPADLLETVNDTLSTWSETSGALLTDADMNVFFHVPAGFFFTDPRALYDASSGRFFVSGWSFDASNDSQTYLAVSDTQDPTGLWTIYTIQSNTSSTLTDQPMTGICDDKVVVAWNAFTGAGATPAYDGVEALVLQKSTLVAGTSPVPGSLFANPNQFRLVPAQALSASTTCYMAVNNASSDLIGSTVAPTLGVIAITGTPGANNVALAETDLPVAATNAPPAPQQPGGIVEPATSNDDRMLSAVWQNNELWTSLTDACTPPGDTAVRNCMRLDEVNTSAAAPSLSQDFDLATPGLDEYYPAVSLDSSGDVFVAYSASSSSQDAGAYGVISPATSVDAFSAPITIKGGLGTYGGARWGDYSAAAPDPTSSGAAVWVAGEYAPADAATPDWGTAAAKVSLPAGFPSITSASQAGFNVGSAGSFTVTDSGTPTPTLSEVGSLPNGLTFAGGVISGTPAAGTGGVYPVQVTATNSVGTVTQTLTVLVTPLPALAAVGAEGGNGELYAQAPQLFSGWIPLGGQIVGAPAVAAWPNPVGGPPLPDAVFIAAGSDGELWMRSLYNDWQPVGPSEAFCIGSPAATVIGSGPPFTLVVACEGLNHALYYNTAFLPMPESPGLPTFTNPWTSLGGILSAGPAVATAGQSGTVTFFVRGTNGQIFTRTTTAGYTATPFFCIGAPAAATQAITSRQATGSIATFACEGGDHSLWEATYNGTGFSGAQSVGGLLGGVPGIAAATQQVEFFVEGTDGTVWKWSPSSGWVTVGGIVQGGVGATALN